MKGPFSSISLPLSSSSSKSSLPLPSPLPLPTIWRHHKPLFSKKPNISAQKLMIKNSAIYSYWAREFYPSKPFKPGLIFASKVRSLPRDQCLKEIAELFCFVYFFGRVAHLCCQLLYGLHNFFPVSLSPDWQHYLFTLGVDETYSL